MEKKYLRKEKFINVMLINVMLAVTLSKNMHFQLTTAGLFCPDKNK